MAFACQPKSNPCVEAKYIDYLSHIIYLISITLKNAEFFLVFQLNLSH